MALEVASLRFAVSLSPGTLRNIKEGVDAVLAGLLMKCVAGPRGENSSNVVKLWWRAWDGPLGVAILAQRLQFPCALVVHVSSSWCGLGLALNMS